MDEEWAGFVNFRQRRLKLLIDKKIPCFLVDALIEHYIAKSSPHGPRTADRPKSTRSGHPTRHDLGGRFLVSSGRSYLFLARCESAYTT